MAQLTSFNNKRGSELTSGFCSTGAAEDGRAPTEELACIQFRCFCSTGRRTKSVNPKPWLAIAQIQPIYFVALHMLIYIDRRIELD